MKLFYLFLSTLLIQITVFGQRDNYSCAQLKSNFFNAKSASLPNRLIKKTELYDVKFYKLDLTLSNTSTLISGTVTMEAISRTNMDTIVYELFPTLTISQVQVNGVTTQAIRNGSAVLLPKNIAAGTSFKISTTYSGTPPNATTNPLGGSGLTNASSPTWGNQVTWSLSQPFSAYEWWPCKQSLRDKIDSIEILVTVPSNCKAGSNGMLKNVVNLPNGKSRYEWKHKHPISYYLVSVAVAKYVEFNVFAHPAGSTDSILIQNFVYDNPATLQNFQQDIEETADFVELFSDLYGPYPFKDEKYGHCMAPLGGGMEHQTMTTQGSFNKNLTAHELGHQWFGDHVTCASWADIWVNEGFATYSEYLMLENLYPGEEVAEMAGNHSSVMSQNNGAVWVEDSLNGTRLFSSRLTYNKGASIIHTFRFILNNDSIFFRVLKKYLTKYSDSTALGTDFQKLLEEESGINFTEAFEQWYFGEGHPTYTTRWNNVSGNLHLRITQAVSAPTVTPKFTNPLEIRFKRTGLPDTTVRFDVTGTTTNIIVPGMGNVSSIFSVDPNNWIVNRTGLTSRDPNLVLTSIENVTEKENWTVFPNPAKGLVQVSGSSNGDAVLKVLNTKGKFLFSKRFNQETSVDLTEFPSGIYLFKIEENDGLGKTFRLIRK